MSLSLDLYALLTLVALALAVLIAAIASVYVRQLERRPTTPISEEIGAARTVIKKVRKREVMSNEELEYARRVVADRASLRAVCIPGALFMLSIFFVFGSLYHLHGATPSERTFLGVLPMLTSTNLAIQLRRSAALKRRLKNASAA